MKTPEDVRITPPPGFEVDEENSTFTVIKWKPIEPKLPISWYELTKLEGSRINEDSHCSTVIKAIPSFSNRNLFASKTLAESTVGLAMYSQLLQVYEEKEALDEFIPIMKSYYGSLAPVIARITNYSNAKALWYLGFLLRLRDKANIGWNKDLELDRYYGIVNATSGISNIIVSYDTLPLVFRTEAIRDNFYNNYKALIEIAKPLL